MVNLRAFFWESLKHGWNHTLHLVTYSFLILCCNGSSCSSSLLSLGYGNRCYNKTGSLSSEIELEYLLRLSQNRRAKMSALGAYALNAPIFATLSNVGWEVTGRFYSKYLTKSSVCRVQQKFSIWKSFPACAWPGFGNPAQPYLELLRVPWTWTRV